MKEAERGWLTHSDYYIAWNYVWKYSNLFWIKLLRPSVESMSLEKWWVTDTLNASVGVCNMHKSSYDSKSPNSRSIEDKEAYHIADHWNRPKPGRSQTRCMEILTLEAPLQKPWTLRKEHAMRYAYFRLRKPKSACFHEYTTPREVWPLTRTGVWTAEGGCVHCLKGA